jgi:hypothetical protein
MSAPDEFKTSSFWPLITVSAEGTSLSFSLRRVAVTTTSVGLSLAVGVVVCAADSCAQKARTSTEAVPNSAVKVVEVFAFAGICFSSVKAHALCAFPGFAVPVSGPAKCNGTITT